ncbi:hypothetical protein FALCPG4_018253 [Fusarium falciforme]
MVASNIPSFRLFGLLPAELRLQIWRMAFDNLGAAVSVCQFEGNQLKMSLAYGHGGGRDPAFASACREARREWLRLTRRDKLHLNNHVYLPRTVLFLDASFDPSNHCKELADVAEHVALDILECSDILETFEALASFPRLRTIIIPVPYRTLSDEEIRQWQEDVKTEPDLLQRIAVLTDEPSLDGEWGEETYIGWLVRHHLSGQGVREFYSGQDSPRIKLLVDESAVGSWQRDDEDESWSLVFY